MDNHRKAVEAKHAKLEQALREELQRPSPDSLVVQRLKKEKLALKDQL